MVIAYVRNCPTGPDDKIKALAHLTLTIADSWPAALQGAIAFLDRSVQMLPASKGVHIWPDLLTLRGRA